MSTNANTQNAQNVNAQNDANNTQHPRNQQRRIPKGSVRPSNAQRPKGSNNQRGSKRSSNAQRPQQNNQHTRRPKHVDPLFDGEVFPNRRYSTKQFVLRTLLHWKNEIPEGSFTDWMLAQCNAPGPKFCARITEDTAFLIDCPCCLQNSQHKISYDCHMFDFDDLIKILTDPDTHYKEAINANLYATIPMFIKIFNPILQLFAKLVTGIKINLFGGIEYHTGDEAAMLKLSLDRLIRYYGVKVDQKERHITFKEGIFKSLVQALKICILSGELRYIIEFCIRLPQWIISWNFVQTDNAKFDYRSEMATAKAKHIEDFRNRKKSHPQKQEDDFDDNDFDDKDNNEVSDNDEDSNEASDDDEQPPIPTLTMIANPNGDSDAQTSIPAPTDDANAKTSSSDNAQSSQSS